MTLVVFHETAENSQSTPEVSLFFNMKSDSSRKFDNDLSYGHGFRIVLTRLLQNLPAFFELATHLPTETVS